MEIAIGLGALLLGVIAALTKIARVFDKEWSTLCKALRAVSNWMLPYAVGFMVGINAEPEMGWGKAAFALAAFGLGLWLLAQLFTGIERYNQRRTDGDAD